MLILIEDAAHCETIEECDSFEDAITRLEELAKVPWDREPNLCPCTAWRTCGREYQVTEYDDSTTPWRLVRQADVLTVNARGVEWVPGFEYAWAEPEGE